MTPSQAQDTDDCIASKSCLACRSRKVKCDRSLPDCRNCLRVGVKCPQYDHQGSASRQDLQRFAENIFSQAGVERRKVGSCKECHATKHKCSRTRPYCRRCRLRGLDCVYPKTLHDSQGSDQIPEQSIQSGPNRDHSHYASHQSKYWPEYGVEIDLLCSDTLPDNAGLRLRLVTSFFDRSHPLRCLGFLHKPSFMRSLDRDTAIDEYGEALLYIVCALGARHIYFDIVRGDPDKTLASSQVPGQKWAERARKEVLAGIHEPTIHQLMTVVLLCDYAARADQHAAIFVLNALLYPIIRLFGLDRPDQVERSTQDGKTQLQRQTEINLVWACYFIDNLMSSGIAKNSGWREDLPDIALPSTEDHPDTTRSQHLRIAQIEGAQLQANLPTMELSTLLLVLVRLRSRVLRLIRTNDTVPPIWDPSSDFMQILDHLDMIYHRLPRRYSIEELNLYALRDKHQVGAVFFLHFLTHTIAFDLTKISLAGFNFPLSTCLRQAAPVLNRQCQERCWYHAQRVSDVIRKGMAYGYSCFDDVFAADAAFESAKIQLIYASTVDCSSSVTAIVTQNLASNITLLDMLHRGKPGSSPYVSTILRFGTRFGFYNLSDSYVETRSGASSEPVDVTGSAEVDHLTQFATFRRAKAELPEARGSNTTRKLLHQHNATPSLSSPLPSSSPTQRGDFDVTAERQNVQPSLAEASYSFGLGGQVLQTRMPDYVPTQQNDAMESLSIEDCIRTADGLSSYLMDDMSELPPWINFNDPGGF